MKVGIHVLAMISRIFKPDRFSRIRSDSAHNKKAIHEHFIITITGIFKIKKGLSPVDYRIQSLNSMSSGIKQYPRPFLDGLQGLKESFDQSLPRRPS